MHATGARQARENARKAWHAWFGSNSDWLKNTTVPVVIGWLLNTLHILFEPVIELNTEALRKTKQIY